jgi:AcrR family transcriptional regulator
MAARLPTAAGPARKRVAVAKSESISVHSRERIHRAALGRFARYGYDAVSLQQIADEVGLHKSSLFHHYAGKAALLRAVLSEVLDGILQHLRPLQTDDAPSAQALLRVFRALADHFCDQPNAARLLLALMTSPDDSELRRQAPNDEQLYVIVGQYLDRARRAGVVGRIQIRQAIPNLIGLMLAYPAVAHDLTPLLGGDPFSARVRQARREDLERALRSLLQLR